MNNTTLLENTFKKGVLKNKEYTLKPIECPIKLNQNESPFDIPENLKNIIITKLKNNNWNVYPDFVPINLYNKIAKFYNLDKENILIGNGSNEMIYTVLTSTMETGKTLIIPQPTFTVYKLVATNLNANIIEVMLKDDFSFDIEKLIESVQIKGSVCVISSPNNPTGTFAVQSDLKKIIEASNGIVVIDEAYIHFGGESVIDLINNYSNLIVLRTFSKAFGLAGLRLGMMFSNKEIIKELAKVKLPYNINIFSILTLDTMFDNITTVEENVKIILKERDKLYTELIKFNKIKVIPSSSNFFLVKIDDSKWLFEQLIKYGILIRDVSYYPKLDNCLRISVGSEENNQLLIKALKKIYNN